MAARPSRGLVLEEAQARERLDADLELYFPPQRQIEYCFAPPGFNPNLGLGKKFKLDTVIGPSYVGSSSKWHVSVLNHQFSTAKVYSFDSLKYSNIPDHGFCHSGRPCARHLRHQSTRYHRQRAVRRIRSAPWRRPRASATAARR